ncbi:uncharacterized protein C1orf131 [Eurosta solidaginis]|uniref:uncharacterized protein C1orf131 n=1 Tax=Eurosta solidaginis TaxID=178769 RepID=UPI003530F8C6
MNSVTGFKPVQTRAALALQQKNQNIQFQALVFDDPKKHSTEPADDHALLWKRTDTNVSKSTHDTDAEEFDIKKTRNEVLRFAMNNQRVSKNKKKMEIFQLVKLGMKPPKKPYKNYKQLLDERKRLKDIREQRKKFHELGKNQTGSASVKCRSKTQLEKQNKKRAPVTHIDQNYGVVKPKLKRKK